jgi:primosomal protein N' (replication factor Y) (superfamily II helicase)
VQQHNYKGMFDEELLKRKQFAYPPYTRMILLTFKHKIREVVEMAAHQFATALQNKPARPAGGYGNYIVGPAEPVINRIRNQYLMEMLLKLPRDGRLIAQCKHDILEQVAILHNEKRFRSVVIVPDVDVV